MEASSTHCNFTSDCVDYPTTICVSNKCVCPASTEWSSSEGVCIPAPCSKTNYFGYCSAGFTCAAGTCEPQGCKQLDTKGCSVCSQPVGAPTNVAASGTSTGATVSWNASAATSPGLIYGYVTQAWDASTNAASGSASVNGSTTSASVTLPSGTYKFSVVPVIAEGFGPASGLTPNVTVTSSVSTEMGRAGTSCPPSTYIHLDAWGEEPLIDVPVIGAPTPVSCDVNSPCPNGYMCVESSKTCQSVCSTIHPNGVCPAGLTCINNVCSSHCSPPCAQNHVCVQNLRTKTYSCECEPAPEGACRDKCGNLTPHKCSPGTHCSGMNCVPNSGTTCPTGAQCGKDSYGNPCGKNNGECLNGLTCSGYTCTCADGSCPPPPKTLLDQVLVSRDQCPSYLQGDIGFSCYLNLLKDGTHVDIPTIPSLPDPSQGATAGTQRTTALRSSLSPGVILGFNSGAIEGSNYQRDYDNFLDQSYTDLPGQTDIQVLFADDTNVNTMNPQKCSPGETGLCATYGGGLPCIPGPQPTQLSPWFSSDGFTPPAPYTKAYPKYWSIWGCQRTQECAQYYTPSPIFIDGEWKYACVRNPLPVAQICHNKSWGDCGHDDSCHWSTTQADSGYSTHCDGGDGAGCSSDDTVEDIVGQQQMKVPPGYIYPQSVTSSIPNYTTSTSFDTIYPISSYSVTGVTNVPLYTSN